MNITKGKWEVWENGDGEIGVEVEGDSICTIEPVNTAYGIEQMKANARLIAAAPKLLRALEAYANSDEYGDSDTYQDACEVIAEISK